MRASVLALLLLPFVPHLSAQAPASSAPAAPSAPSAPKLFAARYTKGPAWDESRKPNDQVGMGEHSANLGRLRREGKIVLGARYGDTGLIVLRGPADEAAVREEFRADPTIASGVFRLQVDVFAPFFHGNTAYLTTPEAMTLRAYYDAFNRHDADAVAAFCAEDIKWYSIADDKMAAETESRAQLREWLAGYFKSLPTVRSDVLSLDQSGAFLSVRERPSWTNKAGQPVASHALGVYEIRDNLIRRAWYFPSTREPPPAK